MTEVATRPELGEGIVSHQSGLEIGDSLSFNDWKRLGEQLLTMRERVSWSIGDWWAFGQRFGRDYAAGVAELESSDRSYSPATLREYARVAVAFPLREEGAVAYRMPEKLSFAHHHHVLSMGTPASGCAGSTRPRGKAGASLSCERSSGVAHAVTTRVDVLNLRVMEETYRLARGCRRRRMDPRVWFIEAIREQAVREIQELVAGNGRADSRRNGGV